MGRARRGKGDDKDRSILVENARIVQRNFAGKAGRYNSEGTRNFNLIIDEETHPGLEDQLKREGWNVKYFKVQEEGDEPQPFLPVEVKFEYRPPMIVMLTSRGRTILGEEEVSLLDSVDIEVVDLIVRPYDWEVNEKSGIKAYLQSLFITIREDALQRKYANIEDMPTRSGRVDEG